MKETKLMGIRLRMSLRTISLFVSFTARRGTYSWGSALGCCWPPMYALSGKSGLVPGVLWGLAGFVTFHLGPALVVPPSIPALVLAPLALRQAAWLIVACCTGLGLGIFAFGPKGSEGGWPPAVVFCPACFFAGSFRCPEAIFLRRLFPHLSAFSPCTYSETSCCSGSFSARCQDTCLNNPRTFTATRARPEPLQAPKGLLLINTSDDMEQISGRSHQDSKLRLADRLVLVRC